MPQGVMSFIDCLDDDLSQTLERLMRARLDSATQNLLITTASDSVVRKEALADLAVELFTMTRILEISLPLSSLGPTLTKNGVTYTDVVLRRKANFYRQDIYRIQSGQPILSSLDALMPYVLGEFLKAGEIWFPKFVDGSSYMTSEYEYSSGNFIRSQLIPFNLSGPGCLAVAPKCYSEPESSNPRHGIVKALRRIRNHDSLPSSLVTVQSDVGDLRFASPWANNTVCQGSTFNDLKGAELSALGEAYERYCVNIIDPKNLLIGSASSLRAEGFAPIDPDEFVLFSPEQLQKHHCRFEHFDHNTVTTWVEGHTHQNEARFVPATMVFVNYPRLSAVDDFPLPRINAPAYAGISAGQTKVSACANALQEIMERHATMCWWHNPPRPNFKLKIPRSSELANLIAEFEGRGNQVSIVGIANRFKMPIYAATLLNIDHKVVNTGFGCRPTNEAAILKALTEAATLQAGSFDLLNPNGELFKAIERGELSRSIAKPWRTDRCYLDYYSDDFSEMNDLMLQQQVYLDPRLLPRVEPWLFPGGANDYLNPDLQFRSVDEEVEFYITKIASMSVDPVIVDVTSPDVRCLQVSVVRVVAPGLVPNFAIGDLHLGKQAIQNEPALLGLNSEATPIHDLNVNPLPHC